MIWSLIVYVLNQTGLRSTKDFYNKLRVNLNASAKYFGKGFAMITVGVISLKHTTN